MRRDAGILLFLGLVVGLAQPVVAQLGQVELISALENGLLRAEFRGNGDESVFGRIWSAPGGPSVVTIEPGTQFWAQADDRRRFGQGGQGQGAFGQLGQLGQGGGFSQRGGGGRQGMGALGMQSIDLGGDRFAGFVLPTACTNLGLPSPTRRDLMIAVRCPDPRVASVAAAYGEIGVHPAAVQVAIWALANDPPAGATDRFLSRAAEADSKDNAEATTSADSLLASAAQLLVRVGLAPGDFQLFR